MIDLAQAKFHLRVDGTEHDADIQLKLGLATAIVSDYVGDGGNFEVEQAAILLVLGELWMNRESSSADVVSPAIRSLLERTRVPAFA